MFFFSLVNLWFCFTVIRYSGRYFDICIILVDVCKTSATTCNFKRKINLIWMVCSNHSCSFQRQNSLVFTIKGKFIYFNYPSMKVFKYILFWRKIVGTSQLKNINNFLKVHWCLRHRLSVLFLTGEIFSLDILCLKTPLPFYCFTS